jgi:RNA polymerase sigma-70 factor (ECF subfamily)
MTSIAAINELDGRGLASTESIVNRPVQRHNEVRWLNPTRVSGDSSPMEPVGIQGRAGFEALCQLLRPELLRFAFWLCRDYALAEDVIQESMLRAWKAKASLQDEKAAKPWFLTIVRRELARTFERKRLPTVNLDDLIAAEEPALAVGEEDNLAVMRAAIFRLPDDYREPLVMQVLLGYSTADIARELDLSEPAVLTRLFRARAKLRVLCGENTTEDPPA